MLWLPNPLDVLDRVYSSPVCIRTGQQNRTNHVLGTCGSDTVESIEFQSVTLSIAYSVQHISLR